MPDMLVIADLLASSIVGAQKAIVPGIAHMVNMERSTEFNRLVLEFLRSGREPSP
jgi:pimeloyl-ACP methyl ester carboxylesterase